MTILLGEEKPAVHAIFKEWSQFVPLVKTLIWIRLAENAPGPHADARQAIINGIAGSDRQSSFAFGVDRSDRPFRGFSPGKTTPRDLCQTTVIAKLLHVSNQPKVTCETITDD
jgi:hypothetical protein